MSEEHEAPSFGAAPAGLSKNRIEALTDGIYAVAMTLLVIDLKVPDPHRIASHEQLLDALIDLLPKALSWIISFFVLAIFWLAHHRLFQVVRHVDNALLWRNIMQLGLVSLLPFSASLLGEYGDTGEAHAIYNVNMLLLAITSLSQLNHVYRRPEMQAQRMTRGKYHGALLRIGSLAGVAVTAMALIFLVGIEPYFANYAYLAMWPIGVFSRRLADRDPYVPAFPHSS